MTSKQMRAATTIAVACSPPGQPGVLRRLLQPWHRHVMANAAPRDRQYMQAALSRQFPDATLLDAGAEGLPTQVPDDARTIVLLYSDPIGLGLGKLEAQALVRWPERNLLVLNGRQRLFRLDTRMHRRLAFRRFLATVRLPEAALCLLLLMATPLLLLIDLARGRR